MDAVFWLQPPSDGNRDIGRGIDFPLCKACGARLSWTVLSCRALELQPASVSAVV